MQVDPNDPLYGSGETGDPATGSSPPSGDAEVARLKEENAKLRADRRNDRVRSLVAEHELSASQALDLASLGDLNDIEAKAAEFAAAKPPTPAPPEAATPPPPTGEPAKAEQLASMENGGEGASPSPESLSWIDQMNKEVNEAGSLEEIVEIQNRYRVLQQERVAGGQ